jgi:hypothetical protein
MPYTSGKKGSRLMGLGYCDILARIHRGGASWIDVAAEVGCARMSAQSILYGMEQLRLIHVAEWRRVPRGKHWTQAVRVYALGPGDPAPWPGQGAPKARKWKRPAAELVAFASLVRALEFQPLHKGAAAAETGMSRRSAQQIVSKMHKLRLVRIAEYDLMPGGGYGYPMFQWDPGGGKPDAKKPKAMTKRQCWDKHNAQRKARDAQAKLMRQMVLGRSRRPAQEAKRNNAWTSQESASSA